MGPPPRTRESRQDPVWTQGFRTLRPGRDFRTVVRPPPSPGTGPSRTYLGKARRGKGRDSYPCGPKVGVPV